MASDQDWSGKTLGKYQILRRLGQGGMGVVYLGHDTRLDRRVAIKILSQSLSSDPTHLERFLREARAAARFSHPNVVTIHEIDEQEGVCFIAMELMAGSTLDLARSHGRLSWVNATRAVAAVCRALAAAHSAGLIHRDIKPGNILRSATCDVKLSDFGLAKLAGHEASLTTTNSVLGTPTYMSPEQCRAEELDERSDLYSLGVTYYELLTGRPPYVAEQPLQVCFAHCTSPIPDASTAVDGVPIACSAIITRAMAKEPRERYANASEMLADLRRALLDVTLPNDKQAGLTQVSHQDAPPPPLPFAVEMSAPPVADPPQLPPQPPPQTPLAPPSFSLHPIESRSRASRRNWLRTATVAGIGLVGSGLAWSVWSLISGSSARSLNNAWKPLFNGRDLAGWIVRPPRGKWNVEDGALVGRGGGDSFCFLPSSDWTDFHLRVECRINDRGNSGIFFRCELNDSLPPGYEAHIDIWNAGRLHRNGLHGRSGIDPKQVAKIAPNEWFTYEVIAVGRHITLVVNGETTIDFTETEDGPLRGFIALQCYEPQTVVAFRRVEWRKP